MTQALEVKKQNPLQEFRSTMEAPEMKKQVEMALPSHVKVDKFIRVVTTAVANDPALLEANRMTLYNAAMKAAADGLVPDGKEAALVVFNKNAGTKDAPKWEKHVQYMPMVAGILKKVRNSGELSSICAFIVHKNEPFSVWVDNAGEHFKHEPLMFGEKGEPIGVYALAQTKDGGTYFEVMSKDQVMKIREVAKTKNIWDGPFGSEKWKVACIRRLSKRLPMSTDLEQTIQQIDDEIDLDEPTPTPAAPVPETSSRLAAAVSTPPPAAAPRPAAAPPPAPPKAAPKPAPAPAPAPQEEPNEAPLNESEEDQLPI